MSSGITEVALLPLKAGSNVKDPNTPEGTIVQESLTTVLGQPGCQRAFWGVQEEDKSMMHWFVDWDSVDAHKTFMKSRDYEPFLKNLGSVMSGSPELFHVPLQPHPATAALSDTNAPMTEILSIQFESGVDKSKAESDIKSFVSKVEESVQGTTLYKGSAGGWAEEGYKGGKLWLGVIGWESVEAHQKAKEKFGQHMPILKNLAGLKGLSAVHASLQEQTGGGAAFASAGGMGGEERGALATNPQEEVLNPHEQKDGAPKTHSDGTTTKHNDDLRGAANEVHKERAGRGPYKHSVNHGN